MMSPRNLHPPTSTPHTHTKGKTAVSTILRFLPPYVAVYPRPPGGEGEKGGGKEEKEVEEEEVENKVEEEEEEEEEEEKEEEVEAYTRTGLDGVAGKEADLLRRQDPALEPPQR